jgi:hypothetical protein
MYYLFIIIGLFFINTTAQTWSYLGYNTANEGTVKINFFIFIFIAKKLNQQNGFVYVLQLDVTRNVVFIGGSFSTAGGINANNIAQYNLTSSTWSSLGKFMFIFIYVCISLSSFSSLLSP